MRSRLIQLDAGFSALAQSIKAEKVAVGKTALPALAFFLLLANPACFAEGPSPFDEGATNAGQQSLPKLSTAKEYYVRALKASDNKDYASALADYNEAVRLNPNYGEAIGNRGAVKFNLQDFNGALNDYNTALKFFPANKALIGLKEQAEQVLRENANAAAQNEARARAANQMRMNALLGGDFADPSTMIMQNAQRRGLVPNVGDPSDPATIIMNNAKRRGLIPENTPNP